MTTHELKILPKYFHDVILENKNFELRKNDRDFNIGDKVVLMEYIDGKYTGSTAIREIKYILKDCPEYGLKDGYCIFGW